MKTQQNTRRRLTSSVIDSSPNVLLGDLPLEKNNNQSEADFFEAVGKQVHFTSRVDKEPNQSCLISHNDQATVDVCAKETQHSLCQFATGCNQEIVGDV